FGTPLFDEVNIHLENGNTFTIRANRKSAGDFYVQSARLWRQPYTKTFIEHADLMKGGLLEFSLGAAPDKSRGKEKADIPHSAINQDKIVAVPYFDIKTEKFKKETTVNLKAIEPGVKIFYRIMRPNIR